MTDAITRTVREFAAEIKMPVGALLPMLIDANIAHCNPDDVFTEQDSTQLLAFLRLKYQVNKPVLLKQSESITASDGGKIQIVVRRKGGAGAPAHKAAEAPSAEQALPAEQAPSKSEVPDVAFAGTLSGREFFVDGMNVAHWSKTLSVTNVIALALALVSQGGKVVVIFDASASGKFKGRDNALYQQYLKEDSFEFFEVPGKMRADDFLLLRANNTGGFIVSNDQFRDYGEKYPWVSDQSRLIKGMVIAGHLAIPSLDIDIDLNA
ncbi:hypothetical protein ACFONG_15105 [Uliginosibacterium paludis]|uniref:RNase NYN domain-containing protein n=1 Tax=Uliginosibacterium paludis TaxID=1615952 RepID=A0ABV2CTE7_9RHOO